MAEDAKLKLIALNFIGLTGAEILAAGCSSVIWRCQEREVVLPAMVAYLRIALCYCERVVENTIKRAYSAVPIRETDLYRCVAALRENFACWVIEEKFAAIECGIDKANTAIAKF